MKICLTVLALVFPLYLVAQTETITIKGQVNGKLGNSMETVEITVVELNLKTVADKNGAFSFVGLPRNTYSFFTLYNNTVSEITTLIPTEKEIQFLNLSVEEVNTVLGEVIINKEKASELQKHKAIKANVVDIESNIQKANSLEELLNRSPGVKIRNTGGLGASSTILVGGFTGKAVKFLYDDIPMDYLGSSYGLTKIPTNMIARVEVYKGVLPTKIGIDALGSAVNIIPTTQHKTGGTISYETGSYNTSIATINGTIQLDSNFYIGTNSFYNYSKNNYKVSHLPYVDETSGKTTYIKNKLFHNAFEQVAMEFYLGGRNLSWAEKIELKINSYALEKEIQNDAYSRARPFGKVYRKEKGSFIPSLRYKNTFFNNRFALNQFLVYSSLNFELFDNERNVYYDWKGNKHPTISSSEMGNLIIKDGYLKNTLTQLISRTNANFLWTDQYQLEGNFVYSQYKRTSNIEEDEAFREKNYKKMISNLGFQANFFDSKLESNTQIKYLFGQIEGNLNSAENPTQTRIENANLSKEGFSFSQAFKYSLSSKHYLRFSYENTYRLPDQEELFGDNNFITPNYGLAPEKSNNFNLGYTFKNEKITFEFNSYYRDTKELIRLKDINQYQATFLNLDHVKGVGVEFEMAYKPVEDVLISGNLTWNDFRLKSSKDYFLTNKHYENARIANMPFYYGNLHIAYDFQKLFTSKSRLTVYWDYSYVHQYYLDFIEKQFEPQGFLGLWGNSKINTNRVIPVQNINSIGLHYTYPFKSQEIAISTEIKNIFNEEIYNEFKMQSPGRNFRIKLTYNF